MLIPQFSTRALFVVIAVCGAFSLIGAFAFRGERWAIGVLAAVASVALAFSVYVAGWFVAIAIASSRRYSMLRFLSAPRAESPFAQHRPAPQVLEPREDEP